LELANRFQLQSTTDVVQTFAVFSNFGSTKSGDNEMLGMVRRTAAGEGGARHMRIIVIFERDIDAEYTHIYQQNRSSFSAGN
jgi:hypothetical protein